MSNKYRLTPMFGGSGKLGFDTSRSTVAPFYPEGPYSSSWNDPANAPFVAGSFPSARGMCVRTPGWFDILAIGPRRANRQISSPRHAP